ncbi:MAG: hypothetical protein JRI53_01135 [Deltaproteobacteria bacterium]|nr:hypothetical protein [Deltaproteobacteria bacterium]MBW1983296.1 hypothetical protein [Deltaproteobacteria bacterium]
MSKRFTRIFTNKTIALLAVIFIAIEAVPTIGTNPNSIIFSKVALWVFGAIFVWMNKDWAAIYLAILAMIYFVIDIVLPIPRLVSAIKSMPPQLTAYNEYIPHIIILSMLIEIVFLFCFIYHGIIIFQKKLKTK